MEKHYIDLVIAAAPIIAIIIALIGLIVNIFKGSGKLWLRIFAVVLIFGVILFIFGLIPKPYVCYVYEDYQSTKNHYRNVTHMGHVQEGRDESMSIDQDCKDSPKSGDTCIKITYTPTDISHWAGMMWLSGVENRPPKLPLNGVKVRKATKLTFWAKGNGRTKFYIENNKEKQSTQVVKLTPDWKEYTLEIPKDWKHVCVGFGWASNYQDAEGELMAFYVDEIAFTNDYDRGQ